MLYKFSFSVLPLTGNHLVYVWFDRKQKKEKEREKKRDGKRNRIPFSLWLKEKKENKKEEIINLK